jgi:hypothetical protein
MQLKDAQLFRQQAYIDGAWVDADGGQTIKVNNPATGEIIGTVPKWARWKPVVPLKPQTKRCRPGVP